VLKREKEGEGGERVRKKAFQLAQVPKKALAHKKNAFSPNGAHI